MIKILSWNIACLPENINTFKNNKNRLKGIMKFIEYKNPDIICLQEVFTLQSRILLKDFLKKLSYNLYFSPKTNILLNGGLLIASKYDIIDIDNVTFKNSLGEDVLSYKGIIYIKIKYNNNYINIFNTHLNNEEPLYCLYKSNIGKIIKYQLNEFLEYFYSKIRDNINNIYILTGDFNLPFNSKYYKCFMNKLKKKINIIKNKNEIITDNKNNIQIDYINTCFHKNFKYNKNFKIYTYSQFSKLSDHNPLLKKIEI